MQQLPVHVCGGGTHGALHRGQQAGVKPQGTPGLWVPQRLLKKVAKQPPYLPITETLGVVSFPGGTGRCHPQIQDSVPMEGHLTGPQGTPGWGVGGTGLPHSLLEQGLQATPPFPPWPEA